jgi:hypothetical protein
VVAGQLSDERILSTGIAFESRLTRKTNAPGRRFVAPWLGVDMQVQALWRSPVKSMRSERLTEATLQVSGMQRNRNIVVVLRSRGNIVATRTHPGLQNSDSGKTAI